MSKKNYQTSEACTACGKQGEGMVCFHHLFTQKVYQEFAEMVWNKIPVCQECHNSFHSKGTNYMAINFNNVYHWLVNNGWFFCDYVKKWRRDGF